LAGQASQWATPDGSIANLGETPETFEARQKLLKEKHGNGNGVGTPLAIQSQQWATPAAERITHHLDTPKSETGGTATLGRNVAQWHTPSSTDYKGTSQPGQRLNQLSEDVEAFPHGLPPATTLSDGSERSPIIPGSPQPLPRRKLNCDFVEWLMDLPPLWTLHWPSNGTTVCGPAEMESYLSRQRLLLSSYLRRVTKAQA
jgi:hypothetical protein